MNAEELEVIESRRKFVTQLIQEMGLRKIISEGMANFLGEAMHDSKALLEEVRRLSKQDQHEPETQTTDYHWADNIRPRDEAWERYSDAHRTKPLVLHEWRGTIGSIGKPPLYLPPRLPSGGGDAGGDGGSVRGDGAGPDRVGTHEE